MAGCSLAALTNWNGVPGILTFVVLLSAAVYICLRLGDARKRSMDRKDSLAILQRRLAAGDITPEEFVNLKQYL